MVKTFKNMYAEESEVYELLLAMFRVQSHEDLLPSDSKYSKNVPQHIHEWTEIVRNEMTDEMKEELKVFFNFESYFGLALNRLIWKYDKYRDIEEFISYFEESVTGKEIVSNFFYNGYTEVTDLEYDYYERLDSLESALEVIRKRNTTEDEKWKLFYLYSDADNTKARLLKLIKNFHEDFFKAQLQLIKKKQQESLVMIQQEVIENGKELIGKMVRMQYEYLEDFKEIVFIPSYFHSTATTIAFVDSKTLLVIYGLQSLELAKMKEEETDVIDAFKALADDKRIKIIQMLIYSPYYGYEIGQKLNLSNSTISHHLSYLTKHGIIKPIRQENKIYYEVDKEKIKEILDNVKELLIK